MSFTVKAADLDLAPSSQTASNLASGDQGSTNGLAEARNSRAKERSRATDQFVEDGSDHIHAAGI